jgi:uncharacterized protein (TIGR03067 family)
MVNWQSDSGAIRFRGVIQITFSDKGPSMINILSVLLMGVFLAFSCTAKEEKPKPDDLQALQGTWLTTSLVTSGKTLIDKNHVLPAANATKLTYEGKKWILKVGDKAVATGAFAIDSTKTPKEIDVMDETGTKNGKTQLGIYTLDGDNYKYCVAPPGKPRPTEFESKEGDGLSLIVSKREKGQ